MPHTEALEALHSSDQRVVRTVDSLTDQQWGEPSLLPGWTRSHVVGHLTLNAEGFSRALSGLQEGEPIAIYDSNAQRDADIADLGMRSPSEVRDRFLSATGRLRRIMVSLTEEQWAATVNRLPEGPVWPAVQLLSARRLEVEVHHADLAVGYTHRDWPDDFTVRVLDQVAPNHAASPGSDDFAVRATDLNRTWRVGAEAPVVSGPVRELAWWLLGRGTGEELSHGGTLPRIGAWTKPVVREP